MIWFCSVAVFFAALFLGLLLEANNSNLELQKEVDKLKKLIKENYFEINGTITTGNTNEEDFNNEFLSFLNKKGYTFGGKIKQVNENGTEI